MPFSPKVQEDALVACGRFCCICHRFAGTKIEIHHIIQKAVGGSDDFDNAIPLCLDCHADMGKTDARHPGRKAYKPSELKRHRDNWYKRMAENAPVQPDEEAEKFRRQYKELRNEANRVLTFYGNVYTNIVEKPDDAHIEAEKELRIIGTMFKVLAEQDRGDCPDVPSNAELMEVFHSFIGLSNSIVIYPGGDAGRRLDEVLKREEKINEILGIT